MVCFPPEGSHSNRRSNAHPATDAARAGLIVEAPHGTPCDRARPRNQLFRRPGVFTTGSGGHLVAGFLSIPADGGFPWVSLGFARPLVRCSSPLWCPAAS